MRIRQAETTYDGAARRQSRRSGRERGVWIYVAAVELERAGIDPAGPAPKYRTWGMPGRGIMARLYRD